MENAALYSLAAGLFNLDPGISWLTSYLRNRIGAGGLEGGLNRTLGLTMHAWPAIKVPARGP